MLKALCKRRPVDLATLKLVDGMSDKKVADYGADIIKVRVDWGVCLYFYVMYICCRVESMISHLR